jgi:uncharacterized membrane protein
MKKSVLIITLLSVGLAVFSCASTGYQSYNTQGGAFIGGALGALAGQAIGRNTAGTLIGAGAGTLIGAIIGNAMDQDQADRRMYSRYYRPGYGNPAAMGDESPPGQWIVVPGRWAGGRWVPPHKVWVPVNP